MVDDSELRNLMSEDIKSIDVVSNPGVVLRVAYRFNSAKSKYKGTGAGEAAKQRM